VTPRATSGALALAVLFASPSAFAQGAASVQLRWRAPSSCPQELQVRQKLGELLGPSAGEVSASRLRAEGKIEAVRDGFRLTLDIHYDRVDGARVVRAASCEDLAGVAAVTLAVLFRSEHSSSSPLTARDLSGEMAPSVVDAHAASAESPSKNASERSAASEGRASGGNAQAIDTVNRGKLSAANESIPSSEATAHRAHWRFVLSAPELRADVGVLPETSYGLGVGVGARHDAWRFIASGALWLAQDYQPGPFVGYGAHFARVSGELSGCHAFSLGNFEISPCLQVSIDDVSARATGIGVSSSSPRTAWLSVGAGGKGSWMLGPRAALFFGVNGRVATSQPRFVSEATGEVAQVGAAALGLVLGCEWQFW